MKMIMENYIRLVCISDHIFGMMCELSFDLGIKY